MTWIHCNQCFMVPMNNCSKTSRIWFTSCGHLLCAECLKEKRPNGNGQSFECLVCHQQNAQLVELNRHLKPELVALFRPPKDLTAEFSAKLRQIITFQQSHQQRLIRHLMEEVSSARRASFDQQRLIKQLREEVSSTRRSSYEHQRLIRHLKEGVSSTRRCSSVASVPQFRPHAPAAVASSSNTSVPHFRSLTPAAVASSSNTSVVSRRSFSYLSPATLSYNRSMNNSCRKVPPLLPGRITNAPIVPRSFTIHSERDNTDTDSFLHMGD